MAEQISPEGDKRSASHNPDNFFRSFILILPLIGGFFVFLGILKLDIYYSYFGISIVDYLSFSEILTSFLDDLNIMLFCTLLIFLHVTMGARLFGPLLRWGKRSYNKSTGSRLTQQQFDMKAVSSWFGVVVGLIMSVGAFWLLFTFQKTWMLYLVTILIWQEILVLLERVLNITNTNSNESVYLTFAGVLLFLSFTCSSAYLEIERSKSASREYVIELEAKTVSTTSQNIWIGKTDRYIFLHNVIDQQNRIIPIEQVKEIIIK